MYTNAHDLSLQLAIMDEAGASAEIEEQTAFRNAAAQRINTLAGARWGVAVGDVVQETYHRDHRIKVDRIYASISNAFNCPNVEGRWIRKDGRVGVRVLRLWNWRKIDDHPAATPKPATPVSQGRTPAGADAPPDSADALEDQQK